MHREVNVVTSLLLLKSLLKVLELVIREKFQYYWCETRNDDGGWFGLNHLRIVDLAISDG